MLSVIRQDLLLLYNLPSAFSLAYRKRQRRLARAPVVAIHACVGGVSCLLTFAVTHRTSARGRPSLRNPDTMSDSYNGPHAAELALAFEIAAEAGRMITSASAKRWQQSSNEQGGTAGSSEPGTKKNSVDVRLCTHRDSQDRGSQG